MKVNKYIHMPYFGVILEFPIVEILGKNETHTTLIYRAWGIESKSEIPNEWLK